MTQPSNLLRVTLLGDGSSDRVLRHPITWLLQDHFPQVPIEFNWADLVRLAERPRKLAARVKAALSLYPCDVLFIHRDAENEPAANRYQEIEQALTSLDLNQMPLPHYVGVVPVRMTETWFLFDEVAIRRAADNPNGRQPLKLPPLRQLEGVTDPKQTLFELLRQASELTGRRLKHFSPHERVFRVADSIDDFSPLRGLTAFTAFETGFVTILSPYIAEHFG